MAIGRRSKLAVYQVSAEDCFDMIWNITTLGEIVFSNRLGLDLLEMTINKSLSEFCSDRSVHNKIGQWSWDSKGYYMNSEGMSFIKFKPGHLLILWRDNFERKDNNHEDSNRRYTQFFEIATVMDIIGAIIS